MHRCGGALPQPLQERLSRSSTRGLCFCSDIWISGWGSLFLNLSCMEVRSRAGGRGSGRSTFSPSPVGSYSRDCLHLLWVSSWGLYHSIWASIALYRAVEGKRVGKLLILKANKATKNGHGCFKHAPALWISSTADRRKTLKKSHGFFNGPRGQQGLFPGSPECPKKAAKAVWFLLGDVAAREEHGCQEGPSSPGTSGEQPGPIALPASSGWLVRGRPASAVQAAIMQKALKW